MRTDVLLLAAVVVCAACKTTPPPVIHVSGGRDVVAGQNRTCQSACIGYKTCAANADGNGCTMSQACITGFANGTVGGAVIY